MILFIVIVHYFCKYKVFTEILNEEIIERNREFAVKRRIRIYVY